VVHDARRLAIQAQPQGDVIVDPLWRVGARSAGAESSPRTRLSGMLAAGVNRQFHQAQPGTIAGI